MNRIIPAAIIGAALALGTPLAATATDSQNITDTAAPTYVVVLWEMPANGDFGPQTQVTSVRTDQTGVAAHDLVRPMINPCRPYQIDTYADSETTAALIEPGVTLLAPGVSSVRATAAEDFTGVPTPQWEQGPASLADQVQDPEGTCFTGPPAPEPIIAGASSTSSDCTSLTTTTTVTETRQDPYWDAATAAWIMGDPVLISEVPTVTQASAAECPLPAKPTSAEEQVAAGARLATTGTNDGWLLMLLIAGAGSLLGGAGLLIVRRADR